METLLQDLRYAVRTLLRAPGFTLVAVVTLALGIGASSTLFSIVNAVLLRPLPYPEPDRLVSIGVAPKNRRMFGTSAPHTDYYQWRDQSRSFTELAAFRPTGANLSSSGGAPARVDGAQVSANLATVLGVRPQLGRMFTDDDDRPGGASVVLLGHALWQEQFGGDRDVVGRVMDFDGSPVTVVGVLPSSLEFPRGAQFWRPLSLPHVRGTGGVWWVQVVGRLRPGVALAGARGELAELQLRGEAERPEYARGGTVDLVTLHERLHGASRTTLLILLGAVGLMLLIACANVANLLLARAAAREREFAIRSSLGAGRARLVRQLLAESLVLSAAGGAAGLLVPLWSIGPFMHAASIAGLRGIDVRVDWAAVAFTAALALMTGLLFGLAPAVTASGRNLVEALKGGSAQAGGTRRGSRLRRVLVVSELAAAMVLVVGAGLLLKSLLVFLAVDLGFHPDRVLAAEITLSRGRYPDGAAAGTFFGALLERAAALPGVSSAALADVPPLGGFYMRRAVGLDDVAPPRDGSGQASFNTVSADYFATVGIAMVSGRAFTAQDRAGAPPVAIVNASFARRFFPGTDPVGHRLNLPENQPERPAIVGVVGDVRQVGEEADVSPEVFLAAAQTGNLPRSLVLRTVGDPSQLAGALRQSVRDIDPSQPVSRVYLLTEEMSRAVAPRRFNAVLLGAFAALALLLAATGLYGVMAYLVAQRTHEIGVRIALGAGLGDVLRLVVGQGARLAAIGLAIGLAGSLALSRVLTGLLFRVSATDPTTLVVVPVVLALVALLATWLPARRATRVDPIEALRSE